MDTSEQAILEETPKREARRRRSPEEKLRIVEETLEAGASVARVARHGVNANQVFYWRKKYRKDRNSIEALTRIFYASQWATAIFGGLTALAIVIGIVVSVRKDVLVAKQEEDRGRLSQQVQTGQNQTIDSLERELEKQKSVAEKVPGLENRIRELTVQRSLSPEQKSRLMAALRASPQHHLIIMHAGDLETQAYADEIKACISSSGWVIDLTPFRYIVHSVPGLHISVQDVNHPPDGAEALLNALMSIGLKVSTGSDESKKPDEIWLWVGPKELPKPE